jgi:hypothetical protein
MAFEYPARDEIPKLSFVVCRSLSVVGDALGRVNNLPLTGLDMADKVRSGILFAFTGENDRGVSSILLGSNPQKMKQWKLTCDR